MTGRRNRIHTATNFGLRHSAGILPAFCLASQKAGHFPCGKSLVPPPAPLSSVWLFIWIKKMDSKNFQLQRTAAKFSANIIWLLVYLFVGSPRLRGTPGYRVVVNTAVSTLRCRADPYMVARSFRRDFKKASGYAQTK